jgi:hypothetical protein
MLTKFVNPVVAIAIIGGLALNYYVAFGASNEVAFFAQFGITRTVAQVILGGAALIHTVESFVAARIAARVKEPILPWFIATFFFGMGSISKLQALERRQKKGKK